MVDAGVDRAVMTLHFATKHAGVLLELPFGGVEDDPDDLIGVVAGLVVAQLALDHDRLARDADVDRNADGAAVGLGSASTVTRQEMMPSKNRSRRAARSRTRASIASELAMLWKRICNGICMLNLCPG